MSKNYAKTRTAKSVTAQINNVWIKFYAEQCIDTPCDSKGVTTLSFDEQRTALSNTLQKLSSSIPDSWSFHAIVHYLDTYTEVQEKDLSHESIFYPANEKPHAHLLLFSNGKDSHGHFVRARLGTVLGWLERSGIKFRDSDLSIMCDFVYLDRKLHQICSAITYHTHETIKAKDTDGKELYPRSDVVTNITDDALTKFYTEYHCNFELKNPQLPTKAREIKESIYQQAFDVGYEFKDFSTFWNGIVRMYGNTVVRSKVIEAYNSGVSCACSDNLGKVFPVCCIFIQGAAGLGKSVCAYNALTKIFSPNEIYRASDNSGCFDLLLPSHKAVVFDDFNAHLDILKLCDTGTFDKYVYRRGSNNPLCLVKYFIFTDNRNLGEYCKDNYPDIYYNSDKFKAFKSRFYFVSLSPSYFKNDCTSPHTGTSIRILDNFKCCRGHGDFSSHRDEMYKQFMHFYREELWNFNNYSWLSEFEDIL